MEIFLHIRSRQTGKMFQIKRRYDNSVLVKSEIKPGDINRDFGPNKNVSISEGGFLEIGDCDGYARKYDCVDVIKRLYKQSGE